MNIEKMREEFEAWSATHDYLGGCALQKLDGRYRDSDLQHAWETWIASRIALIIDLPKAIYWGSSESIEGYDAEETHKAIEAAGLKVKP